ncbi:glycosyltransferase family 2 protein [Sphingomonas sp.]|uniref:glycosyltransferase family 2 protein n=1 Tax=Sphingomonas sp. TaxID=28214 RepID=UPI0025E1DCA3|nr:glycosyltransferase family 2 protein [Sphingomonas sp.]MBV9526956.1 glycosyltransferase family 2 protein [Sphingomonas sp.]
MRLAAVIPCYRCSRHAAEVVSAALDAFDHVFVIDDCCPERTGDLIEKSFASQLVTVLRNPENQGVGGATIAGYRAALKAGYDIIIKMDGDGQMDPEFIPALLAPIVSGEADYTKGNRFYRKRDMKRMPVTRLMGNSFLSLLNKASSGYWNVMDPTNGFTALGRIAAREVEWSKVSKRYFFESDLLFRLNIARAVVQDVPMPARYGTENSNLRVFRAIPTFLMGHLRNGIRRFFYTYILRDFSVGTVHTIGGLILFVFGLTFGTITWWHSAVSGQDTSVGTVMIAMLPIILGFQLLLNALAFDIANVPTRPLQRILSSPPRRRVTDNPQLELKDWRRR